MRMDLKAAQFPINNISKKDGISAEISNRRIYYTAAFKVGSEEDEVEVLVEMILNLLWFPTPQCDSYYYKRDNMYDFYLCDSKGTYSPEDLTSFTNSTEEFQFMFSATSIGAWGYLASDRVQFGDYTGDVTFGVAEAADSIGRFGLGLPGSPYLDTESANGSSFLEQLVDDGTISSQSYSIQLGLNNATEGSLILGALDHSKYRGELQKVRMVDAYMGDAQEILIILDGILGNGFSVRTNIPITISCELALLSLSNDLVQQIASHMDAEFDDYLEVHILDCSFLNLTDLISFYFSGIEIEVPLRDLVFQATSGSCLLTCFEDYGPPYLGQDVLRNSYVVVDLDNKEVALAQAAASDNEEIEDIVSSIPLALEAPLYSYTDVGEKYSFDGYDDWETELFDVQPPSSYSFNTGSRSVDLGTSVYKLEFPSTSTSTRSRSTSSTSSRRTSSTLSRSSSSTRLGSTSSRSLSITSRTGSITSSRNSASSTFVSIPISESSNGNLNSGAGISSPVNTTPEPESSSGTTTEVPTTSALGVGSSKTYLSFVLLLLSVFLVF